MEKILTKDNMNQAYRRVVRNKGKQGIDGMTVGELLPYLKENGNQLRKDILQGKYKPKSVRRAEISKSDRGVRLLGILNSNRQNDSTSHCPTTNTNI